ncbi:MAG: DNA/RNA non-specific endonuclease [Ginsengibacter sp.]
MKSFSFVLLFVFITSFGFTQSFEEEILKIEKEITRSEERKKKLYSELEELKLQKISSDLEKVGLPTVFPGEQLIKHSAFYLSYSEKHEVPRWVAHIILPDVISGTVTRTNDFRVDSSVTTGSAVEADYFLKTLKSDSTFTYDGFGYDRGHLAPSADFRWSQKALSESYYYSNISPQIPEFNREGWSELENAIRFYIFRNPKTQVYVITGPILHDSLKSIERSLNKVSIPDYFWKIAVDAKNQKAIGFIMPNKEITKPLQSYAVPISAIEKRTGLSFFSKLEPELLAKIKSQKIIPDWLPEDKFGDVEPFDQEMLPKQIFNTDVAKTYIDYHSDISIVGTVVGARISRAGNILLNLDKQFPNQTFTVFIRKESIPNFSFNPEKELLGKAIVVKGRVTGLSGLPAMFIENEKQLTLYSSQKFFPESDRNKKSAK